MSSVVILLYVCPHTAIYVSYVCVLILLYAPSYHTASVSYCYVCVLIPLYMCPYTAMYVSNVCVLCVLILLYMSSCCYMCHHTAVYSCCSIISVLILLHVCPNRRLAISTYRCNAISTYRDSYCYMRPHTAICVSKQATCDTYIPV